MTDLKSWLDRNAKRPLAFAIGAVLCLQAGYLTYMAYDGYRGRIRRIDRTVETASLGMQQSNRPLIESLLLSVLHNADATTVALCRESTAELLYPPSKRNPCRTSGTLLEWKVERKAVGLAGYSFVFVMEKVDAFRPAAILLAITLSLLVAILLIFARARRKFNADVLSPLYEGLHEDKPLAIRELDELRRMNQEHHALSRQQAVFELGSQVAHDILSPLAALEVAVRGMSGLPEGKRLLIRAAAGRIQDIANSLLESRRALTTEDATVKTTAALPQEASVPVLLSALIGPLISEKRMEHRSKGRAVEIAFDNRSYGLFARVQPVEFARVLSNLVNNGVEALPAEGGRVTVTLSGGDQSAVVAVTDNGSGIDAARLPGILHGGSAGKPQGSGLGFRHARTCVDLWGGSIDISSKVDFGTEVRLSLPLVPAENWFVSRLRLTPGFPIVAVDDDPSIHAVWRERFHAAKDLRGQPLYLLSTAEQLREWVRMNPALSSNATFLVDYELADDGVSGLSLIEDLGIARRSVLVTSRYAEPQVIEECRRLNVRMVPKGLAGELPLILEQPAFSPDDFDAVLIDDDLLVRDTWLEAAARAGKRCAVFSSAREFVAEASGISRTTPIYVDAHLANNERGETESRRIHELGFEQIYLATGYAEAVVGRHAHLRGVVGKAPPWEVERDSD